MRRITINKTLLWGGEAIVGAFVLALTLRAAVSPWHPPVPATHLSTLTVTPAQVTLAAGNDTPSITIVGSGLSPNASLATPGNSPRTDTRGTVRWSGRLVLQTKPGTYVVEAHALHSVFLGEDIGGTLARGTLTMRG
jgi:hypothetical protein